MIKSAYIHIPFCKRKCNYCTFVSYPKLDLRQKYINALLTEIKNRYRGEELNTIYFGGGTPSLMTIDEIKKILNNFKYTAETEITTEINPETVDENYLSNLRKIGVNRLSIGIQDFNDDILKIIGRGHTSQTAIDVVKTAQNVGFDNISIDLIYGLPNQTLKGFETSLNKAFELGIQHISLYGLKIENGCYFYKNPPKNLPDDDAQAKYYLKAIELCKQNGFEHYEISNFALKGFESKHNLNYWNNENYYGFGLSASGYEGNIRYYNETDLIKYIENPLKKLKEDTLTLNQQLEEEIFLGFRKSEGINVTELNSKYDVDFEKMFDSSLKKYSGTYIIKTKNGYKLSDDGFLVSNVILSEFLL